MQLNIAQQCVKQVRLATRQIIRPLFEVESTTNFTRISMPPYSSATSNITSSVTSGRHLLKLEKTAANAASDGFGANFPAPLSGGHLVNKILWFLTKNR